VSVTDTVTIDRALAQPSLPAAFLTKAAEDPAGTALRMFGSSEELTWSEWSRRASAVAGGLQQLGVRRGDRVALLLGTRMEFHIADIGALLAGAIPFSIYATSAVVQMVEIAANAEPQVLITEAALLERARELATQAPSIDRVVVIEPEATAPGEMSLAELEATCPEGWDAEAALAEARRDDICTLVYTSGTTGPPKGVQFRHGAMMDCLSSIRRRFGATRSDRALSYLPMAHIAERTFGHYAAFLYGYEVTSVADAGQLGAALRAVRPTRFFGVPRIYEKLLAGIERYLSEADDRERLQAAWAAQRERVRAAQRGEAPPDADSDASDLSLLRPLVALTGLERAHFVAVAGAPSSLGMLEDLAALGLPINEFYGSSEAIILTCSPPERIRLGTVGLPFDGVRLKLAEDGEILVAGPTVTPGYFRDPRRTAEAFSDGWFHTGDVGALDADGYLRIVDRK
jgi:long-chain acyl-CoA synthetase